MLTTYGMLLARGALGNADPEGANALLEKGAAAGDPFALNALGQRLYFGRDVEQDRKRGLTMLAERRDGPHLCDQCVGRDSDWARVLKADPARALGFYKQSVARNDIYGFNNLGIPLDGKGGAPDHPGARNV